MRYSKGFLRRSSSGKYVGVLKYRDPVGTWRQVTKTFTENKSESEKLLESWHEAMGSSDVRSARQTSPVPQGRPAFYIGSSHPTEIGSGTTIEEAVRDYLSAQLTRGEIELSTHDTQIAYAQRNLFPELGKFPIGLLTTEIAQNWIDGLCACMSTGSARIPFSTLNKTCEQAASRGILPANPLASTNPPRRTRPTRSFLPPAMVSNLEQALAREWGDDNPLSLAVRLGLYAGLRAGETCALRWRDVDERAENIRVTSSIGRSIEGCYVKNPKNQSSTRSMPIVSPLSNQLKRRKALLRTSTLACGAWFVCGQEESFLDPRRLSRRFAELCGRAGIVDDKGRRATFHVLRHTFATSALRVGVDVRTLADLLGHARADMTLNVYAASDSAAKRVAANKMEGMFLSVR